MVCVAAGPSSGSNTPDPTSHLHGTRPANSADEYASERGSIVILEGGTSRKYIWGGQACGGRNVGDVSIALPGRALETGNLVVVPSFKTGGGGLRCLVGIKLQRPTS